MKKNQFLIILIGFGLLMCACQKDHFGLVKGKGENITEVRMLSEFDEIDLAIDADVEYIKDTIYKVEISAQGNILDILTTHIYNGELVIDYEKNVTKHNPIHIKVHLPKISGLSISGSGNINVEDNIESTSLNLKISGSGNIYVSSLKAEKLEATISGSGNINVLEGTSYEENLKISGSGNIETLYLVSKRAEAKISGSGDILLQALESLDVCISGSGNVKYLGTPAVSVNNTGSGNLIHL